MRWCPDTYDRALVFASNAHFGQQVPGSRDPYLRHVAGVAAEVMCALAARDDVVAPDLAVQCALLHDTVEDAGVTTEELAREFGSDVAAGVSALSKNQDLPKPDRMSDSLRRIRDQPPEIWMVKIADRIVNLRPPPVGWNDDKIDAYRAEARDIQAQLGEACPVLGPRLLEKIDVYSSNKPASRR